MTFRDSSLELRARRLVFSNLITRVLLGLVVLLGTSFESISNAQDPFGVAAPSKPAAPKVTGLAQTGRNADRSANDALVFSDDPKTWDQSKKDQWESLPRGVRTIIDTIRKTNPSTPVALARSIDTLINIQRFEEARVYLDRLNKSGGDATQLFDLYQEMGADFFLKLHAEDRMGPMGAEYAIRVSKAVRVESYSPARISTYIKNLSDTDLAFRSENFRRLRRLGAPAVARMIEVFADSNRKAEFRMIRYALQRMGDEATGPLVAAARSDNPVVQHEAVLALGALNTVLANDTLLRAYLSPKLPESIRKIAQASLKARKGTVPTLENAQQLLNVKVHDYLLGRSPMGDSPSSFVSVWSWQARSNRMVERKVTKAIASRIFASQLSSDLYELSPENKEHRQTFLLTQLESLKRLAGPDRKIDVNEIKRRVADLTARELNVVLVRAIELNLIAAATAACEVLGNVGSEEDLNWSESQPCPLVKAVTLGQRHLQFAALNAIIDINPKTAYRGSSYVLSAAVFLASTNGQSSAIVGHKKIGMAQSFSAFLSQARVHGQAVSTGRDLFERAKLDPDVEFLIIADTLNSPHYQELIFQLRNDWRTRNLPIGIMFDDVGQKRRASRVFRDDKLVEVMPLTQDARLIDSQARRLLNKHLPWTTTQEQRIRHADFLAEWLGRIAQNRSEYGFYDLIMHEDRLVSLLFKPGRARAASIVLAQLGTPKAQRALIDYASEESSPLNERKAAARAFETAINRTSTMLTSKEIQQQYDRFNASERQSEQSQQVLGQILDAIEVRSGR